MFFAHSPRPIHTRYRPVYLTLENGRGCPLVVQYLASLAGFVATAATRLM